ncbi:MAG: alanine racemase [Dethiobacter sp.]|nr:alanine racemase [Dethiobacter sp.]
MLDFYKTPALIIDVARVENNIRKMEQIAKQNRCNLRPHIKTHKISELAKMQLDAGAVGITCAKLSEAEVMADAGINDIFIAYPLIDKEKIEQAIKLGKKIRLILGVDSFEGADMISRVARSQDVAAEVRIEIDTGLKRTGISGNDAMELTKYISNLPGLNLTGIYTYRGLMLDAKPTDDREAAGRQEGELLVYFAEKLKKEGIEIEEISVGSTPTAEFAAKVGGVTEIRPGTYIFNDMMQVNIKSASIDDCAAMVLVNVISTPSDNIAVIDGGSKTFSTDAKTEVFPYFLKGYGKIVGYEDLILDCMWEEHGVISSSNGKTNLKIGQKLMVIPNHICTTVNLHDYVYFTGLDSSSRKVRIEARGKLW